MIRWICPECGREWTRNERSCWVCADPPLGDLRAIEQPPPRLVPEEIAACVAPIRPGPKEPFFGIWFLDRTGIAAPNEPGAPAEAEPVIELPEVLQLARVIDAPPLTEYEDRQPIEREAVEEAVVALVPSESPPRLIPSWMPALVLTGVLIVSLMVLMYLFFRTGHGSAQRGLPSTNVLRNLSTESCEMSAAMLTTFASCVTAMLS